MLYAKKTFTIAILALFIGLVGFSLAQDAKTIANSVNFTANISGQPAFNGSVTFIAGDNVTLSQLNRTIRINATGGAGGGGVTNQTVDPWNVNASNITSNTLSRAVMPVNVTYNDSNNNFTKNNTFTGEVNISNNTGQSVFFVDPASNRVGIGTNTPNNDLQIVEPKADNVGVALTARGANAKYATLFFGTLDPNGAQLGGALGSDGAHYGGFFICKSTTICSSLYVSNNSMGGKVGINTFEPHAALDVVGGINATNYTGDGSPLNYTQIRYKNGTNEMSGIAVLSSGTKTVSNTKTTSNSDIEVHNWLCNTNLGSVQVTALTPGVSFVITSTNALSSCAVRWTITERYD